jgi:hypothetical protein
MVSKKKRFFGGEQIILPENTIASGIFTNFFFKMDVKEPVEILSLGDLNYENALHG